VTAELPTPGPRVVAGRYVLGRVLGTGSSAVVRKARDLRSGAVVALKLFHRGSNDVDLRQQRQEMEALAHLDHPGLVGLRDGGNEEGRPFVVTDLVDGPSLDVRLRSGPLNPTDVRRLGTHLAWALDHVHRAGYIHRDVKPANVLLDDSGRARLTDFGIARAVDRTSVTTTGCIVGTAAYLAPEQVRGEFVGPPADVFALGLVLLESLTGRREYPGKAMESALARLHRQPTVPDGLPLGLTPVIAAMTHPDPALRPTAAQVAETLAAPPAPMPAPVPQPTGRHRRAVMPLVAAAMLLVTAAGAIAVLLGGIGASSAASADPPAATIQPIGPPSAEVVLSTHDGP
jgi:eukaryotic-like serine/threonine-protein kinase